MDARLQALVEIVLAEIGTDRLELELENLRAHSRDDLALTIVVNNGVHPIPYEFIEGELFIASEGSFDFTNEETISTKYREILADVARKLKERSWQRIIVIPFGPATLSMQIKLLAYRVNGIETVDIAHTGEGRRARVALTQRDIIVNT